MLVVVFHLSPEGRKENSPGPKAFGPGNVYAKRIALKEAAESG
jgi:hypothetical protein